MEVFDKINNIFINYFSNNYKVKAAGNFIEKSNLSHNKTNISSINTREILEKCTKYLSEKNYQSIINILPEVIEKDTSNKELRLLAAKAYLGLMKYDEAFNEFNKVLELSPDSMDAGLGISQVYLKTEKFKQAIDVLTGISEQNINNKTILKKLSNVYFQFGNKLARKQDYKSAVSKYNLALQYETDPLIYYALGLCSKNLHDFENAEKNFNLALNSFYGDKKAECLLHLGEIYEITSQHSKAIDFYNEALESEDKTEMKEYIKGKIFYNKKYFEHAVKHFKNALEKDPSFLKGLWALAELSEQMKNYQEAFENYEKIIKLDKNNLEASIKSALLSYKTGKKDVSFQKLQDIVLSTGSENAECNRHFARLLLERGKTDDAIKRINKSIQLNNRDPESYLILSNCYQKQKNLKKAFAESEKAFSIGPENINIIKHHAKLLMETGTPGEALKLLEESLEAFPKDKEIFIALGEILIKAKDYKKAIENYKKFLKVTPSDPEIILNLGIAFFENSDYVNTLTYLEKIKSKDSFPLSYLYLSKAYKETKKNDKAAENISNFLKFYPHDLNSLIFAGKLYSEQGNYGSAIEYFKRAVKIDINNTEAVSLLKKAQSDYFAKNGQQYR